MKRAAEKGLQFSADPQNSASPDDFINMRKDLEVKFQHKIMHAVELAKQNVGKKIWMNDSI